MCARIAAVTVLGMLLAACAGQTAQVVDNSPISLEERFYQTAFYSEVTGREWPLERWEKPFYAYVNGATPEERRHLEAVLSDLSKATGLPSGIVRDPGADIRVYFLDEEAWKKSVEEERQWKRSQNLRSDNYNPICHGLPFIRPDGSQYFMVEIPASLRSEARRRCITQEVSHATGLTFDTDKRNDTVFGDLEGAIRLTPLDHQLLRILYDERLEPGMTWAEARPIVRQIIGELGGG